MVQHAGTQKAEMVHDSPPIGRPASVMVFLWMLVALVRPAEARPRYRLLIGDRIPDLTLPRVRGGAARLRDYRGRVLAISFFSKYCQPCLRELPVLHRVIDVVNRGVPPQKRVVPVIISLDDQSVAEATMRAASSLLWLRDPRNAARKGFDPRRFPTTFLVDENGYVRHINRGFGRGYGARVARWLRRMQRQPAGTKQPL